MRKLRLIAWDMRFQLKYGFYFLYAVFTAVYLALLFALPEAWRYKAATVLIFTDPSAMGLFFMGAIVLLEKSQHTPSALAVSPVGAGAYIAAKVASLMLISLAVAAVLALAAGMPNILLTLVGTAVSSVVFTLIGIIIATESESLNSFIVYSVPVELAVFIPSMLHLFGSAPDWLGYYPFCVCADMVAGIAPPLGGLAGLAALAVVLFAAASRYIGRLWRRAGGATL